MAGRQSLHLIILRFFLLIIIIIFFHFTSVALDPL